MISVTTLLTPLITSTDSARRLPFLAGLLCAVFLTATAGSALAACGDGMIDGNEICDPGGQLYTNGEPAEGTCNTGNDCFYEGSCCKFNCQFVGQGASCADDNSCTENDQCDQAGNCAGQAVTDGNPCDDGLFCTESDACSAGVCSGAARDCDDANLCTDDSCDETGDVCVNTDNIAPCDDGLFCTVSDTCSAGSCSGSARDCGDTDICTDDSCDDTLDSCVNALNTAPCDDGLFCTTNDACAAGVCTGSPLDCNDANVCTNDSCDETGDTCQNSANTDVCDDGLFCTENDQCAAGTCSGTALDCSDGDICTDDVCDESGDACVNTDNIAPCDDGLFCTTNDACAAGICTGGPLDCNDSNACTDDSCDETGDTCQNSANTDLCDDGLFCTENDQCAAGTCSGTALDCSDGDICTDDVCDESGDACTNPFNSAPCDDGLFCTAVDTCTGGTCLGNGNACDDINVCTDDLCNETNDSCSYTDNTAPCNDADACTAPDQCTGGACQSGPPVTCDDANLCTDDSCNPASGCVFTSNAVGCDDGLFCTTEDRCAGGVCGGVARDCSDGNLCTDEACNDIDDRCDNPPNTVPCDDGDVCTVDDQCNSGACIPGAPLDCDDGEVCTDDSCDPALGCLVTPVDATVCDDGDPCTTSDLCQSGQCLGSGDPCGDAVVSENCGETCDDGNTADGDGCSATCIVEADVATTLSILDSPDPVTAGSLLRYTINTTNSGEEVREGLVLDLQADPALSFFDAEPAADAEDLLAWLLPTLQPGESFAIEARFLVSQDAQTDDLLLSIATLLAEGAVASGAEATTLVGPMASLAVDLKAHDRLSRSPGNAVFSIYYRNDGEAPLKAAVAEIAGGAGLTIAGTTVAPFEQLDRRVRVALGDLPPGTARELVVHTSVGAGREPDAALQLCAELSSGDQATSAGDCAQVTIRDECDLWVHKTHEPLRHTGSLARRRAATAAARKITAATRRYAARPASIAIAGNRNVRPGGALAWSVRWRDTTSLAGLQVNVPEGVELGLVSPGPSSSSDGVLVWNRVTTPSGSVSVRGTARSDLAPGTQLSFQAELSGDAGVLTDDEFTTTVLSDGTETAAAPAPAISIAGLSNARPGTTVAFTVRYANATEANTVELEAGDGLDLLAETLTPATDDADAFGALWTDLPAPSSQLRIRAVVAENAEPGSQVELRAILANSDGREATSSFFTNVLESGPVTPTVPGSDLTYELDFLAPCERLENVTAIDEVPQGLNLLAAASRAAISSDAARVKIGPMSLDAGRPVEASIFTGFAAETGAYDLLVNSVQAEAPGYSVVESDPLLVPGSAGVARLTLNGRRRLRPGRVASWTVRYRFTGPDARLAVSIPPEVGLTYVAPAPISATDNILVWEDLPTTAAGMITVRGVVREDAAAEEVIGYYIVATASLDDGLGAVTNAAQPALVLTTRAKDRPDTDRPLRFRATGTRWVLDEAPARVTLRFKNAPEPRRIEMLLPEGVELLATNPPAAVQEPARAVWENLPVATGKVEAEVRIDIGPHQPGHELEIVAGIRAGTAPVLEQDDTHVILVR